MIQNDAAAFGIARLAELVGTAQVGAGTDPRPVLRLVAESLDADGVLAGRMGDQLTIEQVFDRHGLGLSPGDTMTLHDQHFGPPIPRSGLDQAFAHYESLVLAGVAGLRRSVSVPLFTRDGRAYGRICALFSDTRAMSDDALTLLRLAGRVLMDIRTATDQHDADEQLIRLLDRSPTPVAIYRDELIVYANQAAADLAGVQRAEELLGRSIFDFLRPDSHEAARTRIQQMLATGDQIEAAEYWMIRADGAVRRVAVRPAPVTFRGELAIQAGLQDLSQPEGEAIDWRYQALHDALTGLPNRLLLRDRLQQALASAHREGHPLAVLLLDLDGFKAVNDTFGHRTGDALLCQVAARLRRPLRESDTIARLGGDEFVLVLPGVGHEGAIQVARKLLRALRRPFDLGDRRGIWASVGIAVYPDDAQSPARLLELADEAMYRAKKHEGGYALAATDPTSSPVSLHRPHGPRS